MNPQATMNTKVTVTYALTRPARLDLTNGHVAERWQAGATGSRAHGRMIGGQAGLIGHLRIGNGAKIAAQTGLTRDVAAGEAVGGSPAVPMMEWLRTHAMLRRMALKKDRG